MAGGAWKGGYAYVGMPMWGRGPTHAAGNATRVIENIERGASGAVRSASI